MPIRLSSEQISPAEVDAEKMAIPILFYALIICLLVGRPLRHPWGTHGNPGAMVQFWYFFFSRRGWELFSFGNDFAGPRGHSHGICTGFGQRNIALDQSFLSFWFLIQCDRQGEKFFTWYHNWWVKMTKKRVKKLDTFVRYFYQWKANMILWSDNKRLNRVVLLFLTTCKRWYVVGVNTSPLGKGYLSLILSLLPGGSEWFLFVTKYKSGQCLGGQPTGKQMISALGTTQFPLHPTRPVVLLNLLPTLVNVGNQWCSLKSLRWTSQQQESRLVSRNIIQFVN